MAEIIKYIPETQWNVDGNLVYNLKWKGWKNGEPTMVNDVAIQIDAHHLSQESQKEIAVTIASALNQKFFMGNKD